MALSLPWSENFTVGHAVLDGQHQSLVGAINEICDAVQSKRNPRRLGKLLTVLRATTAEHIREENAVLWEIKSGTYEALPGKPDASRLSEAMAVPTFDEHIAEHERLLAHFDAITGGRVDTLCEALMAWFLDHAIKHDSRLRTIFQAM
jgi:hemerythrin